MLGEEEEEEVDPAEEDPEEEEAIVLALAEALPVVATAAPAEVQAAALEVHMEAPALEAPVVEVPARTELEAQVFLEVVAELQVLQTPEPIQVQTTTATVPATADTDPALTSQERATATRRKDTEPDGELTSRRLEEILTPRKLSGLA